MELIAVVSKSGHESESFFYFFLVAFWSRDSLKNVSVVPSDVCPLVGTFTAHDL